MKDQLIVKLIQSHHFQDANVDTTPLTPHFIRFRVSSRGEDFWNRKWVKSSTYSSLALQTVRNLNRKPFYPPRNQINESSYNLLEAKCVSTDGREPVSPVVLVGEVLGNASQERSRRLTDFAQRKVPSV